jgi:hypothetical protein
MTTAALDHSNAQPTRRPKLDVPHSNPVLRQTQALIGTVILAGVALAYLVHVAWLVLPAIVGVGLLAAGVTGVCPMALLIARLPWNRAAERAHKAGCCGR